MKPTALVYLDAALSSEAEVWADRLGLNCIDGTSVAEAKPKLLQRFLSDLTVGSEQAFLFVFDAAGLGLHALGPDTDLCIRADFHGPTVTYRRKQGGGGKCW